MEKYGVTCSCKTGKPTKLIKTADGNQQCPTCGVSHNTPTQSKDQKPNKKTT